MLKKRTLILFLLFVQTVFAQNASQSRIQQLLQEVNHRSGNVVMVVSHRGDWRSYPENSLEAIQGAIKIGVDVIEIDVQQTKDGEFVLMHDGTVDRTTNGRGKIADMTLEELGQLRLKDFKGNLTDYKIPTLRAILIECKDRVLLNLDKVRPNRLDAVYALAAELGVENQIILKSGERYEKVKPMLQKTPKALFMPIISLDKERTNDFLNEYETNLKPFAYEVIPTREPSEQCDRLKEIMKSGRHIWFNTLSDGALGHSDEKAMKNPDENWGWVVKKGVTMIQTDRPAELIHYLNTIGKHWNAVSPSEN